MKTVQVLAVSSIHHSMLLAGVPTFTEACGNVQNCGPQKRTTGKIDSLGDRLTYRLAYRNISGVETLVVNHSIREGTSPNFYSGIRWHVDEYYTAPNSGAAAWSAHLASIKFAGCSQTLPT